MSVRAASRRFRCAPYSRRCRALSLLLVLSWPVRSAHAEDDAITRQALEAVEAARAAEQSGSARVSPRGWPSMREPEVVFVGPRAELSPGVAARQKMLQLGFEQVRHEARGRTWLLGGLLVVSATLLSVGSVYRKEVGAFLLPIGALGLIRGVAGFTLLPDPRDAAERYLHMPQFNAEQVRAKIHFGEQALSEQARAQRRMRILDGTLSCLVATSYVPLNYLFARHANPDYRFKDDNLAFGLLTLSVVSLGSALVSALRETGAEQRYREYRELVSLIEQREPGALEKLVDALSLSATRQRLELDAQVRF